MIAIPKEPAAFKDSSVEKKQLAICGTTNWPKWDGESNLCRRRWSDVWLAKRRGYISRLREGECSVKEEGRKGTERQTFKLW